MLTIVRATIVFVAALLSACDNTSGPDPVPDQSLDGWVRAYSQVGDPIKPTDWSIAVTNARDETHVITVRGDGSWAGKSLGPEPYVVVARADGYVGVPIEGLTGGTSAVRALLMERSTIKVLRVDEAVLRGAEYCGNPNCMNLRFTAANDGLFPSGYPGAWFRLFISDSAAATPENYSESRWLIFSALEHGVERGETETTFILDRLRGFDEGNLDLDLMSVYVVGATVNQVGLHNRELEEAGWPDLAEIGAGAGVSR